MQTAQDIKDALKRALEGLSISGAEITLEHPTELEHGDYATGAALQCAKQANMKPRELADKLVEGLRSSTELGPTSISKIEVAGPGFINFYLSPDAISQTIEEARTVEKWGANENEKGKTVMVEYTDPNPFKEFHIGHLMSNAIGESIARFFEFSGANVKRANYQGDVGLHVAKAIFAKMKSPEVSWGVAYQMGNDAYETSKEEIDAINKKVYERDSEIHALYEAGRKETLAEFELIYEKLGMEPQKKSGNERFFNHYFFESASAPPGIEIVKAHPDVFEESDGARVFRGEKEGLHTRVFLTSQRLPTYEAKDLGLLKLKSEVDVTKSFTVTASEQNDYFSVVLAAAKYVPELKEIAEKTTHVSHGMMRFAEGKMSSRRGNVVTALGLLQELFEVAKERAKESRLPARSAQAGADDPEKLAEQVALAAAKYQILKQAPGKDIIFNREQALSLEGDSGPYLQYAHARAHQVVERAKNEGIIPKAEAKFVEPNDLPAEASAQAGVSRLLARFPDIVERAAKDLEPQLVANYMILFASAFNRWYANEQILDGTEAAPHKVALADAARATLKNGLWLLGIPAPERM